MTETTTGLRLLAVDDEPPALDELAYLLRADPRVQQVRTAGDAVSALKALEHAPVVHRREPRCRARRSLRSSRA